MQAVERTAGATSADHKITFNAIKARLSDLMYKVFFSKLIDMGHITLWYAPSLAVHVDNGTVGGICQVSLQQDTTQT